MTIGVATYVVRSTTVTDTFPYTWLITDDDDLAVYDNETLLTKTTHYTVSGVGSEGGNVVLTTALTSGHTLTIVNKPALLQSLALTTGGDFNADAIEANFDRLTNVAKMLREMFDRVPLAPISYAGPISMDALTDQAGKLLRVNDDEDGFDYVSGTDADVSAVTFPLSVANGGTNAATAAAARTSLEAQPAKKGTDVSSATALTLGEGNYFVVTGAVTIETISAKPAGTRITLRFSGASVMTHSASLILLGATDCTPAAGDIMELVADDSTGTVWREVWRRPTTNATSANFFRGDGTFNSPSSVPPPGGHLFGLTLSNGTDATNDIDIAAGDCTSDDATIADRVSMSLTSALTKQLDAAWAVGTNQGGLDTGSIANDVYHVYLIKRTDTGVVDALFSADLSPTMPTDYDKKRRIGSIIRSGATILAFVQDGDLFQLEDPPLDISAANPGTSAVLRALTVPTEIRVRARMNVALARGTAINGVCYISDPSVNDEAASLTAAPLGSMGDGAAGVTTAIPTWVECMTNTSAQVRSRLLGSAADTTLYIATLGWWDTRGRDS